MIFPNAKYVFRIRLHVPWLVPKRAGAASAVDTLSKPALRIALLALAAAFIAGTARAENSVPAGLEAALRLTISRHPAVAGKRAEVRSKDYAIGTARAAMLPSISVQASSQDNHTHPVTLQASQPIWAFGRISSGIAYAKADKAADEADLLRVERQLVEQTATAYANVLGARTRLAIAADDVTRLEGLYERIRRRRNRQMASDADVSLALARLNQSRAQRANDQSSLAIAIDALKALTQAPVAADRPVPKSVTRLPDDKALMALAETESADIRLKSKKVAVAVADVDKTSSASMPTVSLQVQRYYNQPYYGDKVHYGIVLHASLDSLGFATVEQTGSAAALQQAAVEDLNSTRNDLENTVKSLLRNRDLQQTLLENQGQSVKELTSLMVSYERQYEAGYKSWLDLLNIQRELTTQRLQLAQAENSWLVYTLKLAVLSGRLDTLAGIQQE